MVRLHFYDGDTEQANPASQFWQSNGSNISLILPDFCSHENRHLKAGYGTKG